MAIKEIAADALRVGPADPPNAVRALADHLGTHPPLEPEGIVFHTGARPLSRKRVYQIGGGP